MKTIGIIGGLTWHSTLDYYRLLNEMVNKRLGGAHAAKVILNSVDFAEIKVLTEAQDWEGIAVIICKAAKSLEIAGADCIIIGANTMHKIAGEIQAAVTIPVIHIAAVTAAAIKNKGLKKVALLGTKYTMQLDFYKAKLAENGIETIIPGTTDIEYINNAIYNEFSSGLFLPETKAEYLRIIDILIEQGAEGIILGCTEIPILIKQEDCSLPVFDTAFIHAAAAVDFALTDQ
ncbi:aspartate/glutamate racemase family protein [Ferruginibacter sp.]|nr:aspartate/glutamate racemase family protein [Ferruginibacter sp.]